MIFVLNDTIKSMFKRPKLFLITILTLTTALIIPFIGSSMIESLIVINNQNRSFIPSNMYIIKALMPKSSDQQIASIMSQSIIYDIGILATSYKEYVLFGYGDETSGGYVTINAVTPICVEKYFPYILSDYNIYTFDEGFCCCIDASFAKNNNLSIDDSILIWGNKFKIVSVFSGTGDLTLFIPYNKIADNVDYDHSLYFKSDGSLEMVKEIAANLILSKTKINILGASDIYNTQLNKIASTITSILVFTLLFVLLAVINISAVRYGEYKINQCEYAIRIALGYTRKDLFITIVTENLIVIPISIFINSILFNLIVSNIPYPFTISISLLSTIVTSFFGFIISCLIALFIVINIPFRDISLTMRGG